MTGCLFSVASCGSMAALIALHALQLGYIDPIQHHRQLAGTQFHRTRSRFHSGQLEGPLLQTLVPQRVSITVPGQNLQSLPASRAEDEPVTAERILADDGSDTLRQSVKAAAHVSRFAGKPDPHSLRTVQRLQTRQSDHASLSSTRNNARRGCASNPASTTRLRPPF